MSPSVTCKRPLPLDFFSPLSKRKTVSELDIKPLSMGNAIVKQNRRPIIGTIKEGQVLEVPGLRIISDLITPEEEASILSYLNGPSCTWRSDLSRRTMHFGGTYCLYTKPVKGQPLAKPETREAPPLPQDLEWLIDRFIDRGIYKEIGDKRPEYVIVNEYVDRQGISAHTENFSFHSPVVGLSLGSPDVMRFIELVDAFDGSVRSGKAGKAPKTGNVVDVKLDSRSLCVMSGDSRWKWQHEITNHKRAAGFKRVSLTFRVKR